MKESTSRRRKNSSDILSPIISNRSYASRPETRPIQALSERNSSTGAANDCGKAGCSNWGEEFSARLRNPWRAISPVCDRNAQVNSELDVYALRDFDPNPVECEECF